MTPPTPQGFNLVLTPLAFYFLVYRWGWDIKLGIISRELAPGVMAAMCIPTTTSTCVLFTKLAGGDDALAAFNAAAGNVAGVVWSPLMASWLMGSENSHSIDKAATP